MVTVRKFGFIAVLLALAEDARAAGGAYVVDDAVIVAPGECQVESWAAGGGNGDRTFVVSPACTLAALPAVEFAFQPQRVRVDGSWTTELGGQAKIGVLPMDRFGIGVAPTIGVSHDASIDRTSRYFFNLPMTVAPLDRLKVNLNTGWLREATPRQDFLTWGAGAEWMIAPPIMLIGEVFGRDKGRSGWQAGPRLSPFGEVLDLDLIVGRDLTGMPATWLTFGATIHFGL